MKVTVVGSGYVGLVTGACLAEVGNDVLCVDNDIAKIRQLGAGTLPIHEPGLEQMVQENLDRGRLTFSTDIAQGVAHGLVLFVAVGTPPDEDGSADLQHVKQVARSIGECMNGFRVVVTKSTVPVGTSRIVKNTIQTTLRHRGKEIDFAVVSNPEFLKQGAAVLDFMEPDRIVLGVGNLHAQDIMRSLYAPFNREHERIIIMDMESAEMTKYAANVMLATRISLMNELSNIASRVGADIESVRNGIGADPRIGYQYINPGCGYGGSCFSKDMQALYRAAREVGYEARILSAAEAVNDDQKHVPVDIILERFGEDLSGKCFAVWGLAYKSDTDDMRDAPSRVIMEALWERGASIHAFDPAATGSARRIYGGRADLVLHDEDPYDALEQADGLVVTTDWWLFRGMDPETIRRKMTGSIVVDGRNLFSPEAMKQAGLEYYGIGRS